ncbi:hypothetical protein [Rhodoferax sp.]|uniref:hypothetical protein n=1 Tax=Rhodoferax sp. TaxID=50421 RepID=UPI00374CB5E6
MDSLLKLIAAGKTHWTADELAQDSSLLPRLRDASAQDLVEDLQLTPSADMPQDVRVKGLTDNGREQLQ